MERAEQVRGGGGREILAGSLTVLIHFPLVQSHDQPEVKDWEDPGALAGGGDDGTRIIRAILRAAPRLLEPNRSGMKKAKVWMEVDASHPLLFAKEEEEKERRKVGGELRLMEWRKDLSGKPRFCCWALNESPKDADS